MSSDNEDIDGQEQELYDEFGNYIGPDLDDDDSSSDDDESGDDDDDESDAAEEEVASDVSEDDEDQADGGEMIIATTDTVEKTGEPINSIVLHEDKVHYPSASETYGDDVQTAVLDEDAMDLDVPLVEPLKTKTNRISTDEGKEESVDYILQNDLNYTDDYLSALVGSTPHNKRGLGIVGHLHTGKTSIVDLLLESTSRKSFDVVKSSNEQNPYPRITDTLKQEQSRSMSLVSCPVTTILSDLRGKSYCFTIVDCPGHPNFHDESVAVMKSIDGIMLVVDASEDPLATLHTEMLLKQAILQDGLPITLCINKIDRLIIELKLPPRDMYYKLLNIIESLNEYIFQLSNGRYGKKSKEYFNPIKGNVMFSSAVHGYMFTLESFATQIYIDNCMEDDDDIDDEGHFCLGKNLPLPEFIKRLWGDCYYDSTKKTFHKKSSDCSVSDKTVNRTFVQFILEPLYKIYSACLGENEKSVNKLLRSIGIYLNKKQLKSSSIRPLLRSCLTQFFSGGNKGSSAGISGGFVTMIVKHIPSPLSAAKGKVLRCYSGASSSEIDNDDTNNNKVGQSMISCNSNGPLMIHCVKLYSSEDGTSFTTFGRIYSGTVYPGEVVHVLGEGYSPDDQEDMSTATISNVCIPRGRTKTQVTRMTAGNWVLLDGIDANISKTATITKPTSGGDNNNHDNSGGGDDDVQIFTPLKFPYAGGESVMKLAVEPLNPAELPKLVEGLRRISKAYPMARTRVEESGEHVLFGTGELYMDCIMHDLRHVYSDIEIKVADPVVGFRETVIESSSVKCHAETTNKRNKLTFIAEPLDDGMANQLEMGKVKINDWDNKKLGRYFQTKYDWDLLSSRSVWAFGSSPTHGTNILLDDTLPSEVDKTLLSSCRSSIVQGFQWATREGPLCEEPVRSTKIKILDVVLADKPIHRGGGQIIPTARRTVHSSILTATPRLMEPIYRLQIQCPGEIISDIEPILTRRRGHIVKDKPIAGSTLFNVTGYIPVLDSFGFETDLRTFTQGQAMVHSVFDRWEVVPGDPLDRSIILHPLEPSPPQHLARELLVKTRRRKGLSEDVSINKFFDEGMRAQLAQDFEGGEM